MDVKTFDAALRRAGALSRRGSLRTLGGAALIAGLAAPAAARAGKPGKNGRKRCQRQRGQCLAWNTSFCEAIPGGLEACIAALRPCCEPFARCNAGEGIACLVEKLSVS
jgi:hypothetical protein